MTRSEVETASIWYGYIDGACDMVQVTCSHKPVWIYRDVMTVCDDDKTSQLMKVLTPHHQDLKNEDEYFLKTRCEPN